MNRDYNLHGPTQYNNKSPEQKRFYSDLNVKHPDSNRPQFLPPL